MIYFPTWADNNNINSTTASTATTNYNYNNNHHGWNHIFLRLPALNFPEGNANALRARRWWRLIRQAHLDQVSPGTVRSRGRPARDIQVSSSSSSSWPSRTYDRSKVAARDRRRRRRVNQTRGLISFQVLPVYPDLMSFLWSDRSARASGGFYFS